MILATIQGRVVSVNERRTSGGLRYAAGSLDAETAAGQWVRVHVCAYGVLVSALLGMRPDDTVEIRGEIEPRVLLDNNERMHVHLDILRAQALRPIGRRERAA
jgi:hypothetical protein